VVNPWDVPAPEPEPDAETVAGLLELLNAQASLLVSTGTGGPTINSVNEKFVQRRRVLNTALKARGVNPPFPYDDLWAWHGHYSQHLPSYASRRQYIAQQAAPVREFLETAGQGVHVNDPGSVGRSTWVALDGRVDGVVAELRRAITTDDLQDVGRRCREILIDAGKLLADPTLIEDGQETPKTGDAKAWLDLFLGSHASGGSRKTLRVFIRAAWDLAQTVTHGDVQRVDAYAAAQATVLIVRSLQQLAT